MTGDAFGWQNLPPLRVKGKTQPVTVFQPSGARERRSIRLHEPRYGLPMVGRRDELAQIGRAIDRVQRGYGQIVGVTAGAGMGKSRLLAEAIRLAGQRGLQAYGGECQAYGTNSGYLVWQNIWRGLFELDPAWPASSRPRRSSSSSARSTRRCWRACRCWARCWAWGYPDSELTPVARRQAAQKLARGAAGRLPARDCAPQPAAAGSRRLPLARPAFARPARGDRVWRELTVYNNQMRTSLARPMGVWFADF